MIGFPPYFKYYLISIFMLTISACSTTVPTWPPEESNVPLYVIGPVYEGGPIQKYQKTKKILEALKSSRDRYNQKGVNSKRGFSEIVINNWFLKSKQLNEFWQIVDDSSSLTKESSLNESELQNKLSLFFENLEFTGYVLAVKDVSVEPENIILHGYRIIYLSSENIEINTFILPTHSNIAGVSQKLSNIFDRLFQSLDFSTPGFDRMGFVKIDAGCYLPEKKNGLECLDDFFMSRFPITREQWYSIMDQTRKMEEQHNLPMVNISWNQIQSFIERLNENTTHTYRLPSGIEWQYACIGKKHDQVPNYPTPREGVGNHTESKTNHNGLGSVNEANPNNFGLFDMAGNTWEWTDDFHLVSEPYGFMEWITDFISSEHLNRVIFGGSYASPPEVINCASEKYAPQSLGASDIGFRLVMEE